MGDEAESVMGGVKVGVNVDIKRSDGRIHSAVVSGVSVEKESVTVEWFERGETKGKEIELQQILGLNQDLAPTSHVTENVPSQAQKFIARPSIPVKPSTRNGSKRNPVRQSHVITTNGHPRDRGEGLENGQVGRQQQPHNKYLEKNETVSRTTGATTAQAAKDRRRSNVVKEVEKLKENREKRRAQQAQILEEQETLRNKDPNDPTFFSPERCLET